MKEAICNGIIKSTWLGFEDHGMYTFFLDIDYGGSGQGFGGYGLNDRLAGMTVRRILEVLETERWEHLPHTPVRIKREHEGFGAKAIAIGHLLNDQWFELKEIEVEGKADRKAAKAAPVLPPKEG